MAEKSPPQSKEEKISELELEDLVKEYHNRARESGHWADYLRAHGGANYLVAIESTEERLRQVYEIESSWYGDNHPISFEEHQLLTNQHKELLIDYREDTRFDFDSIRVVQEALDTEDIFSETNLNKALSFSQKVFSLSRKCTDGFIVFNGSVIKSCVEVLQKDGHVPPCSFAVIGLGSVARGEATPYSDLEYAFIVESDSDREYFQKLAVDSYFRIANLSETPLKTIGIKRTVTSVSITPTVGYRIDGISRRAGHIPTGHPDSNQSLILTVDQLMELYKKEVMSPTDSDRPHDLADLLSTSALIYFYGEGAELYNQFLYDQHKYENEIVRDNSFAKQKRRNMLSRDISNYDFLPEIKFAKTRNKDVKVKVDIFRYPTLLATDLNISLTLNSQYSWETYKKLHQLDILAAEDLRYMHIVLALSIYIRTTAYLAMGGQSELLSIYSATKDTSSMSDRYHVPQNIFIILGCLLIPIKRTFTHVLQRVNSPECQNSSFSLLEKLQSCMHGFIISKTDFMLKAQILVFVEDYQQALNHLYRLIGKEKVRNCEAFLEVTRAEYNTSKSNPAEKKHLEICMTILYHTDDYTPAIEYVSCLATYDKHPLDIASRKEDLARCMLRLSKNKQAETVMNQVILQIKDWLGLDENHSLPDYVKQKLLSEQELSENLMFCIWLISYAYNTLGHISHSLTQHSHALICFKNSVEIEELMKDNKEFIEKWESFICHGGIKSDLATSYNNLGQMCHKIRDFKPSLAYHKKALEMRKAVYGEQTNHSDIAMSYNNIGSVYSMLGDYKQSLAYRMKALEMMKAVYGEQTNHTSIATCYNNVGTLYSLLGDFKQSLVYYMQTLEMLRAIFGGRTNHSVIAMSYSNVGQIYAEMGDYTQSLAYHKKALEIKKAVYDGHTNHSSIATSYNNIGNVYHKIGDYAQSLVYQQKALEIMKVVYGEQTNHSDIATSYNNIGGVYSEMGDYTQSLVCLKKALEVRKVVYCERPNHPDIAISYNNIGMVYGKIGDYTQSLEYYMKALEMRKVVYGEQNNHSDIAVSYNNMGSVYNKMGDYTQSLVYHMKALDMKKAVYGEQANHSDIAGSYNNIGNVYNKIGNYTQSLVYHIKALEMRKAMYDRHGDTSRRADLVNTYTSIGNLYRVVHQPKKAFSLYTQALVTPTKDSHLTAVVLNRIAHVCVDLNDYRRAQQFLHLAREQTPTSNKLILAENYHLMGICHLNTGSWSRCWTWLHTALCLYEQIHGDVDTTTSLAKLHITIATLLLLHFSNTTIALEHAQKALDMSNQLLEKFCRHAECIKVNKEAKSLTDSLHLVKLVQYEFLS